MASLRELSNNLCLLTLAPLLAVLPLAAEEQGNGKPQRLRRAVRLISPHSSATAGSYREIPLADTPEASLSERTSDILSRQSGLQVNRVGAPGTESLVGVRGSNPDQVEYFLEGMPLPKPYNAPLNLEALPLPLFRAVEIFPSFVPAELPAGNIGGAMNFRLRELPADETRYLTQIGMNSLMGSSIAAARLSERTLHFFQVEQSRNRYRYVNNNGTTENSSDDREEWRKNEDFSRVGYTGFYRYRSGASQFSALVDTAHSERGLPGTIALPLTQVRKSDDRATLAARYRYSLSDAHSLQLMGAAAVDRSEIYDPAREIIQSLREKSLAPQVLGGVSYALQLKHFSAALHNRGKYQAVSIAEKTIGERRELQTAVAGAYDRGLFRLAAQGSATFGTDVAAANAFYASPEKQFAQQGLSASGIVALRPGYFFSGKDAAHDTENYWEIYAQVSSAYRAPTLYERFGDNVFVTPADNLRNERALTNAGGIRASLRCAGKLVCSMRSEAYLTGASDYILFTQNSARTLIAVNASSAQIKGIENELMLSYPERLQVALRYTYLDARDYGSIPYYQDKYLPQRPRHHAVATASLVLAPFRLVASLEYRGAVFRDRYNSYYYYLPAKLVCDAGVDYIIDAAAKHTFNLTVKNITDNQEPDVIGYALPGRYILAKWMAEF